MEPMEGASTMERMMMQRAKKTRTPINCIFHLSSALFPGIQST